MSGDFDTRYNARQRAKNAPPHHLKLVPLTKAQERENIRDQIHACITILHFCANDVEVVSELLAEWRGRIPADLKAQIKEYTREISEHAEKLKS